MEWENWKIFFFILPLFQRRADVMSISFAGEFINSVLIQMIVNVKNSLTDQFAETIQAHSAVFNNSSIYDCF